MIRFEAEVVDVRLESRDGLRQRWRMLLTRSEFTPEASTGTLEAIAPRGARLAVPVLGVVMDDGELWHVVEKPLATGTPVLGLVATVSGVPG